MSYCLIVRFNQISGERMRRILFYGFLAFIIINKVLCDTTTQIPKGVCPSNEVSSYCECDNNGIKCFGFKPFNLSTIFSSMSKNLKPEQKHFNEFWLKNHGITELEDNVFNGIRFNYIRIEEAINLTKISANAFNGTVDDIVGFDLRGKNQLGKDGKIKELFDVFSSLPNLRRINLDTETIDKIPENAFKNKQINLTEIDFDYWQDETSHGSIKTIGNNAFFNLNNLQRISFGRQSIDFISKNAFDFELASDKKLFIYLHENNLNDTSFESGVFTNTKRPLYINLRYNKLTYLDEKIFGLYLKNDKNNEINCDLKEIVCDCRMLWLFKNKAQFSKRVTGIKCKNYGIDFWDLTLKDFESCKEFDKL
jgi:hypothetical protein